MDIPYDTYLTPMYLRTRSSHANTFRQYSTKTNVFTNSFFQSTVTATEAGLVQARWTKGKWDPHFFLLLCCFIILLLFFFCHVFYVLEFCWFLFKITHFYCAHRKCWVLAKFDSSTYNVDVIVDESSSVVKDNIKFKLNFTKKMDNTKEAYIPFPSTLFGTRLTIMKKKHSIPIGLFIITKV